MMDGMRNKTVKNDLTVKMMINRVKNADLWKPPKLLMKMKCCYELSINMIVIVRVTRSTEN